jgi:hypothetical protein
VAQITLDDPDIGSFIDQSITATVPENVRMNIKMLQTSSSESKHPGE